MPNIVTNGYGHLSVRKLEANVGNGQGKVVSVKTGSDPADLTQWEMFQFIEMMLKESGVGYLQDEKTGSLTLLKPESPAVKKRKDTLGVEYFGRGFSALTHNEQRVVEHIVSLEKKTGEVE